MNRPEFVGDAIEFDSSGEIVGLYRDYILRPVYQPIYTVCENQTAVLTGYEGLVRPYRGGLVIQPEEFFKSVDVKDSLFVECLCVALHIRGFKNDETRETSLFVNVNVSNYETIEDVEREFYFTFSQLSKWGFGRQMIVFEILETEVANPQILLRLCEMLKANNYQFALDDFGTKHSNVERYIAVKPNIIKLDRSLFLTAMKTIETSKLLKSLIVAFQENGVKVLMEGLETQEEMNFASQMNVDMLQGFYLGRPGSNFSSFNKELDYPLRMNNITIPAIAV